jgi:ectoine hydroxylase-related dioxygenase (phytanoyl-CoA dioxygenase family)
VLGEEMVLGCAGTVTSLPGAQDQHVHRDGPPLFNKAVNRMAPAHAINFFVPLVELNENTGTTRLFPGTHTNTDLDPASAPFVDPIVPVGSCLLVDYRLYHQGRANRSEQVRPLLYCVYHQPWFKDYKNHAAAPFLRISEADYAAIPPEHRKLLVWTEHYRTGLY